MSFRQTAAELGRAPSTICREVRRNTCATGYRARVAHYRATQRARRPKAFKLETHPWLEAKIGRRLKKRWSPEQVAERLRKDHPDDPRWWVSPEAIYTALYLQGRGALDDELKTHLRKGHEERKPRSKRRKPLPDMVLISERPPEVEDRAVPGHWEGDLIIGSGGRSQIGILTERSTRYTLLFPLLEGRSAAVVARALTEVIKTLPAHIVKSLTWDQGREMSDHATFTIDSGVQVYFCDPASPWQRGTAENTVGLVRQYLPKNTDMLKVSPSKLSDVAAELNERPRKTLDWETPAEAYARVVGVATTG